MAVNLGARILHIGQNARGPQEHIVFDLNAGIDGDVVLYLYVVSNLGGSIHIDILAQDTALADLRTFHHVGEMPDFRACSNDSAGIDRRGRVRVVRTYRRWTGIRFWLIA